MNRQLVAEARAEALRFLKRLDDMDACKVHHGMDPCPDRAAAKRASLDLTRALAKMRRS